MILYSVIVFLSVYTSAVLFNGFDCQSPENPRYIYHQQCNNINKAAHKKDFAIMQKQNVKSLTGFFCNGFRTFEVSYCGAYSHTKHTGESRFNVPMTFSKQDCMQMISSTAYNTESQSSPCWHYCTADEIYSGDFPETGNQIHWIKQPMKRLTEKQW